MVVGSAIEDVPSSVVGDAHERIVGRRLEIIPVSRSLRHAVESISGNDIGPSGADHGRGRFDNRRPGQVVGAHRVVDRYEEEISEEDLPSRQDEEIAVERGIIRSVRCRRGLSQACPIPLQKAGRSVKELQRNLETR